MLSGAQKSEAFLPQLSFPFFYHMTHKANVAGIMRHGILSHLAVRDRNDITAVDISDPGAQRYRSLPETAYHRPIHDYVPLYINPRNPMLFRRRDRQHQIVILKISPEVLRDGQHVFCDGNAACRDTRFSVDPEIVGSALDALNADYWNNFPDGKRRRCAEVLIYPRVSPEYIVAAICSNTALADEITRVAKMKVEVSPLMFF